MTETIKEQREHVEWLLNSAKSALQSCVEQEQEWNQKQKEAYETLVEAAKKSEKHRLNKIKMQNEVEELEYQLRELKYQEEVQAND